MFRGILSSFLCLLSLPLSLSAQEDADARRQRLTPGLMIDTGARQGDCDGLRFLPDGSELMVFGDDKVVRRFAVEGNTLSPQRLPSLRWPIYRDSRGMIFTLDLAPGLAADRVVIAGLGVNNSRATLLRRSDGKTLATLDPMAYGAGVYSTAPIWKARFTPDGSRVVLGDDLGQLFVWTPDGTAPTNVQPFTASKTKNGATDRVRLIQFVGITEFISISQEGSILKWNVDAPNAPPKLLGKPFEKGKLFHAELSPDLGSVAYVRVGVPSSEVNQSLPMFDLATGKVSEVPIPNETIAERNFVTVRFSDDGNRFALGVREQVPLKNCPFDMVIQGKVYVFEKDEKLGYKHLQTLPCSEVPQQLAFHPLKPNLLAVAGGDNHELTLWDLDRPKTPSSVIRSPGQSIWGVGLSADGKRFGFQTTRNPFATHASQRGLGDWRVFDMSRGAFAPPGEKFDPVQQVLELKSPSWKIEVDFKRDIWNVVGPNGVYPLEGALYQRNYNERERCYTFIPANPAQKGVPDRLAVGHNWGVSVYDLLETGPKLIRSFAGHEAPTTALGFSQDGKVLISGSRDQTICGWSLEPWPESRELGASFAVQGETLLANQIAKGSPAWEVGLSTGDQIMAVFDDRGFFYVAPGYRVEEGLVYFKLTALPKGFAQVDALKMQDSLSKHPPLKQISVVWKKKVDGRVTAGLTTVRQRPMWRFFPTEKGEFVAWLWRDYYFDTNAAEPDQLAGWQVHDDFKGDKLKAGDDPTPVFHPLTTMVDSRRSPKRVREGMVRSIADPDLEAFSEVEPPQATVRIAAVRADGGVNVELFGMANRKALQAQDIQNLTRYELFVNDSLVAGGKIDGGGKFELKIDPATRPEGVPIEAKRLIKGRNRIRLNVYNKGDSMGSHFVSHNFTPQIAGGKTMHFLGVGVSDYSKTLPRPQSNLSGARDVQRVIDELCGPEAKAKLYANVLSDKLLDRQVNVEAVLAKIDAMAAKVQTPEDIFVLFLAGHGHLFGETKEKKGTRWYYLCHNTNIEDEKTCLFGSDLAERLEKIPCRKIVFLDACRSGSLTDEQLRTEPNDAALALTRRCDKVIFTACGPNESAWERGGGGLFTDVLLTSLSAAGNPEKKTLTALDVKAYLEKEVPLEFKKIQAIVRARSPDHSILKQASQTPFTFRADLEPIELFSRAKP